MLQIQFLFKLLSVSLLAVLLSSCIETNQEYHVNKDGSGKVDVKATMPLEMQLQMKSGDRDTTTTYEDTVKMIKKVKKIIDESKGIEAWKDIHYSKGEKGRFNIAFTAYFPDIQKVDLGEIPVIPVSMFSEDKIRWGENESLTGNMKGDREPKKIEVKEENLDKTVEQIQDQFKKTKMMMSMVLASFSLEAVYHLPYAVKNPYNLEKEDKYALGLTMEGDDIFENYEDLMEDEKRLKKLIKEENIKTFDFNDPRLFKAAYPKGAVYSSEFKTGLFSPSAKNYFDYQQEVEKISPKVPVLEIPEEPEPKVYKSPPKKYKYKFNDVKTKEQLVTIYKNKVAYFDEFNESIYVRKVLSRNRLAEFDVELAFQKPVILKWDPEGEKLALGVDYDIRKREGQSVLRIYYAGNKKPIGRIRTYNELQDFQWISNSKFAYGLVNNSIVFGKINGDTMVNTDTISVLSSERQTSKNIRIKLDLMKGEEDATLVSYDNLSGKIKLWNLSTHETTGSIPVNEASVASDLEVSPNPKYVAVLFKNRIEVFVNGKPYKTITDVQKSLKRISWNPDGSYLAYIDKDHNIVYQKMGSGSKKVVLEGSGQKFSPAEMIELHDKGHWAVSGNKSYDNRFYPLELHYR